MEPAFSLLCLACLSCAVTWDGKTGPGDQGPALRGRGGNSEEAPLRHLVSISVPDMARLRISATFPMPRLKSHPQRICPTRMRSRSCGSQATAPARPPPSHVPTPRLRAQKLGASLFCYKSAQLKSSLKDPMQGFSAHWLSAGGSSMLWVPMVASTSWVLPADVPKLLAGTAASPPQRLPPWPRAGFAATHTHMQEGAVPG